MDIVERLRFDAARCEATFSKGVASNIEEAADEIERLHEVKRRSLAIADERAIEAVKARAENERLQTELSHASQWREAYTKEIEQLREEAEEAKSDALRLHRDKMAYYHAALELVHSETIKNVCGWYPEIEAFRKLTSANAADQQGRDASK